jgi:hypothetical protein
VALANKMARTIWALLAHQRAYQKGFVSRPAQGRRAARINHFEERKRHAVKVAMVRRSVMANRSDRDLPNL